MIKSSPGASLIHNERHFAAAASGNGALVSAANSYSKIDNGDVTKRRRCEDIAGASEGKLMNLSVEMK